MAFILMSYDIIFSGNEIRNFITFLFFRKGRYNKLIISPCAVNGKVFIPAKDGIFDQHRASSISTPQAKKLINAHKLVGLRPWLR